MVRSWRPCGRRSLTVARSPGRRWGANRSQVVRTCALYCVRTRGCLVPSPCCPADPQRLARNGTPVAWIGRLTGTGLGALTPPDMTSIRHGKRMEFKTGPKRQERAGPWRHAHLGQSGRTRTVCSATTTMHAAASTRKHVPSLVSLAARTLTRGRVPGDGAGAERGSGGVKKKVIRPPGPTCRLAPRGVSGSPGSARDTPLARSRGRATRGRCAPGLGTTSPWRGVLGVLRPFVNRERLCCAALDRGDDVALGALLLLE